MRQYLVIRRFFLVQKVVAGSKEQAIAKARDIPIDGAEVVMNEYVDQAHTVDHGPATYEERVQAYEEIGMTTSEAQGVVDAEDMQE